MRNFWIGIIFSLYSFLYFSPIFLQNSALLAQTIPTTSSGISSVELAQLKQGAFLYRRPVLASGPIDSLRENIPAGTWVYVSYSAVSTPWIFVSDSKGREGWLPRDWATLETFALVDILQDKEKSQLVFEGSSALDRLARKLEAPKRQIPVEAPWADLQLLNLIKARP